MGFVQSLLGMVGFGFGIPIGVFLGFLIFIYFEPRDVKEPVTRPLQELDSDYLIDLLPELPPWVMKPEYERVDWLNNVVLHMWPYLDKAICGIIRSTMEPIFAEYIDSFQIKSIDFDNLTLGSIPPAIHGLKMYDSNDNELDFELAVRWAGNPNIIVSSKLLSMQITTQLVDLQISAALRIVLRPFVPTFPCFSSVVVSLMEKPQVDFGLKVMGGDVMAIPGLYHFVQEAIRTYVARVYLWPQAYEVPILDSAVAVKKPVGILQVKIIKAQNLLNKDIIGKSDPYVKLKLSGERLPSRKTSVIMNNLNPEWNEAFRLTVKDPESQYLQIHVHDWEKVCAHAKLGMQVIPLKLLKPYEKKRFVLDLLHSINPNDPCNSKQRGQITLEVNFVPFLEDSIKFSDVLDSPLTLPKHLSLKGAGLLLVTIIDADHIEGKHHNHNNLYVQVVFRGEQRNTKLIKKSRNPIWNEDFQFVLEEAPLKEQIHIEVMSKKRGIGFLTKEALGYVDIKLSDVVYNGHINEKYHLIDSSEGILHVDIRWKEI